MATDADGDGTELYTHRSMSRSRATRDYLGSYHDLLNMATLASKGFIPLWTCSTATHRNLKSLTYAEGDQGLGTNDKP